MASPRLTVADIGPALESAFSEGPMPDKDDIKADIRVADLKAFVVERDNAVETRMKLWVIGATLTQVLALVPVIFFLGGIYSKIDASLDLQNQQQTELNKRGEWMQERQRWEDSVEMWAVPKGYVPPRYRTGKGE